MNDLDKGRRRPLTVYLGESGTPHDSQRVDILLPNRDLSVSVDGTSIKVCDLSDGNQKTMWSVDFENLPVE